MKALVSEGPRALSVGEVPDPPIERRTDAIVWMTTTNICGSDLHMYEGRTDMGTGRVIGHENLGGVVDGGEACDVVKVGDLVFRAFNIACGHRANCENGLTAFSPDGQPRPADGRRRVRLCRRGILQRRSGRAAPRPVGRLQNTSLPESARARQLDDVIWPTCCRPGGRRPRVPIAPTTWPKRARRPWTTYSGSEASDGTGQCNVKTYNRQLLRLIETDKAEPSRIVSR